jgi:hypothetical protein
MLKAATVSMQAALANMQHVLQNCSDEDRAKFAELGNAAQPTRLPAVPAGILTSGMGGSNEIEQARMLLQQALGELPCAQLPDVPNMDSAGEQQAEQSPQSMQWFQQYLLKQKEESAMLVQQMFQRQLQEERMHQWQQQEEVVHKVFQQQQQQHLIAAEVMQNSLGAAAPDAWALSAPEWSMGAVPDFADLSPWKLALHNLHGDAVDFGEMPAKVGRSFPPRGQGWAAPKNTAANHVLGGKASRGGPKRDAPMPGKSWQQQMPPPQSKGDAQKRFAPVEDSMTLRTHLRALQNVEPERVFLVARSTV